jgi:predicted porin
MKRGNLQARRIARTAAHGKLASGKLTSGKLTWGAALAAASLGATCAANAQSASDGQIKALQTQIEQLQRANQAQIKELQRKVQELSSQQAKASAEAKAAHEQAAQAEDKAQAAQAKAQDAKTEVAHAYGLATGKAPMGGWFDSDGHGFFERKAGSGPLTFYVPGGEISAYGNLDVSFDDTSKNVNHSMALGPNGDSPVGNFGWLPAISTNISYFGLRGFQRIPDMPFNFVWQAEVGFDISATPGTRETNSNISDTVNGALFNRNTYVGFSSPEYGAIKIGKTSGPYQNSTAAFNPFAGQIGDYGVIMGNTGGDNRVEFGTRLDHAIWYESPTLAGFQWNLLFSPGQNRADNSDNVAAGESDCTGGNIPGSGGTFPIACNDGSFSNAISTNLSYTNGPFYATAAYERHFKVNRSSDISAIFGVANPAFNGGGTNQANLTSSVQALENQDVADEDAFKVGALYRFPTKTTVGAIFETMHRYVPADLDFQNERQRMGTWFFVSQDLTAKDSIHFGWAHAFKTPGDPGQHNDGTLQTAVLLNADGTTSQGTYASNQNQADMVTASYKHKFTENLTWYTAVAATFNGPSAHFDLGAGGRGVTTDCHDAFAADGGNVYGTPHCWTGTTIVGVSTGVQYRF